MTPPCLYGQVQGVRPRGVAGLAPPGGHDLRRLCSSPEAWRACAPEALVW